MRWSKRGRKISSEHIRGMRIEARRRRRRKGSRVSRVFRSKWSTYETIARSIERAAYRANCFYFSKRRQVSFAHKTAWNALGNQSPNKSSNLFHVPSRATRQIEPRNHRYRIHVRGEVSSPEEVGEDSWSRTEMETISRGVESSFTRAITRMEAVSSRKGATLSTRMCD